MTSEMGRMTVMTAERPFAYAEADRQHGPARPAK
jgi:hypothetical protein